MSRRGLIREIAKQAIDQPLHFLMTAAPVWLSQLFVSGWIGLIAGYAFAAIREYSQWPSSRPWDPPLDWAFLIAGGVVAMWIFPLEVSVMETTTAVDITPLLEQLLLFVGIVLSVVATWAGKKLSDKLGLEKDSETRRYVQEALQTGLNYAMKEARKKAQNIKDPEVENELVRMAANYAITHVPDGLKMLKLDPVRDRARIEEVIRARLPD